MYAEGLGETHTVSLIISLISLSQYETRFIDFFWVVLFLCLDASSSYNSSLSLSIGFPKLLIMFGGGSLYLLLLVLGWCHSDDYARLQTKSAKVVIRNHFIDVLGGIYPWFVGHPNCGSWDSRQCWSWVPFCVMDFTLEPSLVSQSHKFWATFTLWHHTDRTNCSPRLVGGLIY